MKVLSILILLFCLLQTDSNAQIFRTKDTIAEGKAYYAKEIDTTIKYSTQITKTKLEFIQDSLTKNNIAFIEIKWTNRYTIMSQGWSSSPYEGFEPTKAIDCFYIEHRREENEKNVFLKRIIVRPPQPLIPKDSVGFFDSTINLSFIDSHAKYVPLTKSTIEAKPFNRFLNNELEKVRFIYSWIRSNIVYDYTGLENGNYTVDVDSVLIKRVAVCSGFSNLFKYICDKAGIKCVQVVGFAKTSNEKPFDFSRTNHEWNAVKINNKWFLIDVTWANFLQSPYYFINTRIPKIWRWSLFQKRWDKNQFQ